MLLQTNSYIVPKDKRVQHARLVQRFRQTLTRLGCDHFEAYEQVGANWSPADTTGRFVQLMRFRDRKHQLAVQGAERNDATAQALIKEFCELINFPYQQQQGLFAVGFYHSLLPPLSSRVGKVVEEPNSDELPEAEISEPAISEPLAEEQIPPFVPPVHAGSEPAEEIPTSLSSPSLEDEPMDVEMSDDEALLDEMESGDLPEESHTTHIDLAEEK
jgi:hypothetical protein